MSYTAIRDTVRNRFNEVQLFLNYISANEPTGTATTSLEIKIMRGLFYVHLYSALEKSMNIIVQHSLLLISAKNIKNRHYHIPFNTISMMHKIQSIKDSGYKNLIPKSTELFNEVSSLTVTPINETVFSNSLQNVWVKTIDDVRNAFGLSSLTLSSDEKVTFDEIVDKRNAVAHGREAATVVGEVHNTRVLRNKLQTVHNVIIKQIDEFESFIINKKYLKPVAKKYYI